MFLLLVLLAVGAAQVSTRQMVNAILQTYGNPGNVGTPEIGSIIVNQVHHLKDQAQKAALLAEKARYAAKNGGLPLLVSTDQEGGAVSRIRLLNPGFKFYSPKEMQSMSEVDIQAHGAEVGKRILDSGVNMLLAPTLDVADPGTLMDKQGRAFGSTVEGVTTKAQAWVDGIRSTFPNLAIIAKHFPGYNFRGNSDVQPVTSQESADGVRRRVQPFLQVRGLSGVMMNSARYAAFGGEVAAFSSELINIYRASNPNGVVMTDDIVAPSLVPASLTRQARYDAIAQVALKAFKAGCDLILAMDGAAISTVSRFLTAQIDADPALKTRLESSYRRVLALRQALQSGDSAPSNPIPSNPVPPNPTPSNPTAPRVSPCVSDREKARAAQTVLINRGFLNGAADGQFGPRSLAALNAFNLRNNRPSATCLTEAAFSALTGQ